LTEIAANQEPGERLLLALERTRSRLKATLATFGLSPEDGQDLIQDLALLALTRYSDIRNMEGWLIGTAWNRCLMRVRSRRRRVYVAIETLEKEPASAPAQDRSILQLDLEDGLSSLKPRHKDVVVLRMAGYRWAEIARETGYAVTSVRTIAKVAAARMATRLAGDTSAARARVRF
jgi:RNA polymerase sigma factor (sigma-70 family)